MPNKQRTTFQKRQKELARQDKARKKVERRAQRKVEKAQRALNPGQVDESIAAEDEVAEWNPIS
jgi:hypothetical protein